MFFDRWKLDAFTTAGQKAIGATSGISILAFSERAKYSSNNSQIQRFTICILDRECSERKHVLLIYSTLSVSENASTALATKIESKGDPKNHS